MGEHVREQAERERKADERMSHRAQAANLRFTVAYYK